MGNTMKSRDNLDNKNEVLSSFKYELQFLYQSIIEKRVIKKKERRKKRFMKKIIERKRKEAFPRKAGKYNELFQDFGKES